MDILRRLALSLLVFALAAEASAEASQWRFRLSPYAWIAGLEGQLGAGAGSPTVPIDVSPSDVIDDLEIAAMVIFEARKGRHGIFADVFYADIQAEEEALPPPVDLRVRVRARNTLASLAYQYTLLQTELGTVDLLAGARHWRMDSSLAFRGGRGVLDGKHLSSDESWTDPFVGLKGRREISGSRFYLAGGVGVGGFGVGSDGFFEVSGVVGYRWSDSVSTAAGYRMFDVDYRDSGFRYDVRQEGWQLGLSWDF